MAADAAPIVTQRRPFRDQPCRGRSSPEVEHGSPAAKGGHGLNQHPCAEGLDAEARKLHGQQEKGQGNRSEIGDSAAAVPLRTRRANGR